MLGWGILGEKRASLLQFMFQMRAPVQHVECTIHTGPSTQSTTFFLLTDEIFSTHTEEKTKYAFFEVAKLTCESI